MNHLTAQRTREVLAGAVIALWMATGCGGAHLYATELPGAHLDHLKRIYVQHRIGDDRNIHLSIQKELQELGLAVEAGEAAHTGEFDAVVTYIDRYMWDMSMYCAQLTIYVRDTRTGQIVATGSSYRPSLVRKTPEGHARLIVRELFGGSARG